MSQENVEVVRTVLEGWSRGDFSVGAELLAPDFEWRQHEEAVEPGARRGVDIGGSLKRIFEIYQDFRVEPEEFVDAGGERVSRRRSRSRDRTRKRSASGPAIRFRVDPQRRPPDP